MNEGKLNRRIKEMFPILDPEMKVSDSRRVELLELVNEIKNKFPDEKYLKEKYPSFDFSNQAKYMDLVIEEVARWFITNFGDVNK